MRNMSICDCGLVLPLLPKIWVSLEALLQERVEVLAVVTFLTQGRRRVGRDAKHLSERKRAHTHTHDHTHTASQARKQTQREFSSGMLRNAQHLPEQNT